MLLTNSTIIIDPKKYCDYSIVIVDILLCLDFLVRFTILLFELSTSNEEALVSVVSSACLRFLDLVIIGSMTLVHESLTTIFLYLVGVINFTGLASLRGLLSLFHMQGS